MGTFRNDLFGVVGEKSHQLLAVLAQGVGPHQAAFAEKIFFFFDTSQLIPRSWGVVVPSVSWPAMTKPFSARSTCIASVP